MRVPTITSLILAVALTSAASARAEQACVRLKSGAEAGGSVIEHVPADHLTLDAGDGVPVRIEAADIESYRVHPDEESPCAGGSRELPSGAAAVPMTVAQFLAVQDLFEQRRDWRSRYTSLAIPKTLLPLGVALGLAGGVLFAKRDSHRVGNIVMISGAVTLAVALLSTVWITSSTQQQQQLRRIDEQLRAHAQGLQVSPWLTPRSAASTELSAGVAATVRF